jgi:hypothetical protein
MEVLTAISLATMAISCIVLMIISITAFSIFVVLETKSYITRKREVK